MRMLIVLVLVMLVIGALPRWGYSTSWGYGPSGIGGLLVLVLVVLLLTGRL